MWRCIWLAALAALFWSNLAVAQGSLPSGTITVVVNFPAGGVLDIASRHIAKALSDKTGQPFIVENRVGGGGVTGTLSVARAAPDGRTLLMTAIGPHSLNRFLYKSTPYDADREFEPVSMVGDTPQFIVASPHSPFTDLKSMVAYGRANPGKLTVGHIGPGTMSHLAALRFMVEQGIDAVMVPYRGVGLLLQDMMESRVDLGLPAFAPQLRSLRPLAVTSEGRTPAVPEVPTTGETGISNMVASTWYGMVAPAGTPPAVIAQLNRDIDEYLKSPAAQAQMAALGLRIIGGAPSVFKEQVARDIATWGPVITAAHMTLD